MKIFNHFPKNEKNLHFTARCFPFFDLSRRSLKKWVERFYLHLSRTYGSPGDTPSVNQLTFKEGRASVGSGGAGEESPMLIHRHFEVRSTPKTKKISLQQLAFQVFCSPS